MNCGICKANILYMYNLLLFSLELGNLSNLRDLNVMNNELEWLPWQLSNCSSLKILSFDGNAVQKIPCQLMRHQGLTEIYASGNNLSSLPQGIKIYITLNKLCQQDAVDRVSS